MAPLVHQPRTMNASPRALSNLFTRGARLPVDYEPTVERTRAELIASGTVRLVDLVSPEPYAGETDAPTVVVPPPDAPHPLELRTDPDIAVEVDVQWAASSEWQASTEETPSADGTKGAIDEAPRTWGPSVSALRWARLGCQAEHPMPRPPFATPPRKTSAALRVAAAVLVAGTAIVGFWIGAASQLASPDEAVSTSPRSPRSAITIRASRGDDSGPTLRATPEAPAPVVRRAERRVPAKAKAAALLDIL